MVTTGSERPVKNRLAVVLFPTCVLAVIAGFVVLHATRDAQYTAPDSASYEGTAANLRHGHGPTVPFAAVWDELSPSAAAAAHDHVPSSHFPPGYPALLAVARSPRGIGI